MKTKETESSFDALAKEIGNYHTDLYNRLEKLIDSDEEFVDMYKEVKELFRIRENIIKAECNLPKNISDVRPLNIYLDDEITEKNQQIIDKIFKFQKYKIHEKRH